MEVRIPLLLGFLGWLASAQAATEPDLAEMDALIDAGETVTALEWLEQLPVDNLEVFKRRADLMITLRQYPQAQVLAETVAADTADRLTRAEAMWVAGRAAASRGESRLGRDYLRESLQLFGDTLAPVRRAALLIHVANVENGLGELVQAGLLLDEAEALWQSSPDPNLGARLFNARGTWHQYRDDPASALEARRRALDLGLEGGDAGYQRVLLNNLGLAYMELHDYAEALGYVRRALELAATGTRGEAMARMTAGICEFELNRLDEAHASFARAEEIARELGDRPILQWATGELGLVAAERGQPEAAMELFDRALETAREIGDRRSERAWWINKGRIHRDQGRYREALENYRQAEALIGPGQRPPANLYKHMAQSHAGLGKIETAKRLLAKALELARTAHDTKVAWETHRELARIHRREGDLVRADAAYAATLEGIETMRSRLILAPMKSRFFENKVAVYEEYVDFLVEWGRVDQAFEVAERSRARAFLESLAEAGAGPHHELPEPWLDRERVLLKELSRLQSEAREGNAPANLDEQLGTVESELETLYLHARSVHPKWYALRSSEPDGLAQVRAALAPSETMLYFFLGEHRSHLWEIRRDAFSHRVLPRRADLEAAVRKAYSALQDPGTDLAPLVALNGLLSLDFEAGPVLIVPSGILHYFPYETLLDSDERYIAGRIKMSYWPSASALVMLRGRSGQASGGDLLAVADPLADTPQVDVARSVTMGHTGSLGALPHTRVEVRSLVELFGESRTRTLVGAEATETALKKMVLDQYSVIHFATHGWLDGKSPSRSGLVLGAGHDDSEDGLLQFREILKLDLNADLVTLSACQSGLGDLVTGEGMVGIARAFFHAGTSSIVASLWNVNDEASAVLMRRFYRELGAGMPKSEALATARRQMLESDRYAHPFYWAGYVLIGEGSKPAKVPSLVDRRTWLWSLPAGLFALVVLTTLVRGRGRRAHSS